MAPPKSAAAAIKGIEKAHRTFKVGALRALHPELQGAELARAVGREELRDAAYMAAMRKRLTDGAQAIVSTKPPGERALAQATLISSEHRYLAQHIQAAGWRMRSEATISRLKAAGENGAVWLKDDTKLTHTADCLCPGTVVSGPAALAATSRRYEGEIVKLRFASGKVLSVTPNHPILTPGGWVAATLLDVGSHVIGTGVPESVRAVSPREYQVPARVEDVAIPDAVSVGSPRLVRPLRADDFHGDRGGGEVYVVRPLGPLEDRFDASLKEHRGERALVVAGRREGPFPREGGRAEGGVAGSVASYATDRHTGALKAPLDCRPGSSVLLGEAEHGATLDVFPDENLIAEIAADIAGGDPTLAQTHGERGPTDTGRSGEGCEGFSRVMTLDQVVQRDEEWFSGHVYNLQTAKGWFVANDIVVHNCLAMHGRFWTWAVLDKVNPANRHTGCGCALYSRAEASARGVAWTRGRKGGPVKRELALVEGRKRKKDTYLTRSEYAIPMPHFGATRNGGEWDPEEHPREATSGRFVRIAAGEIPRHLQADLKVWQNAVAAGDARRAKLAYKQLYRRARAMKVPKAPPKKAPESEKRPWRKAVRARRDAVLTIQRLNAAVVNPVGAKVPTGRQLKVGSEQRHVGVVARSEGIEDPWTDGGGFGWHLPRSAGNDLRAKRALTRGDFKVTTSPEGHFIEVADKYDLPTARAIARTLEADETHLRRLRASEHGELIHDDIPLNVGKDEPVSHRGNPKPGPYGAVRDWQIGLAAEMGAADIMHRLKELGRIAPDDDRLVLPAGHDADDQAPLDVYMGKLALEVKAEPLRDYDLGDTGHSASIDRTQTARKRAASQRGVDLDTKGGEKPLRPASRDLFDDVQGTAHFRSGELAKGSLPGILTVLVDADSGLMHVFLHEYPDDKDAFTSQPRLPRGLSQALVDGHWNDKDNTPLLPGNLVAPSRGTKANDLDQATMFVGTFPLRYNPINVGDVGRELTPSEIVKRMHAGGPQSFDVGVPEAQRVRVLGRKQAEPKKAKRKSSKEKALELEDYLRLADGPRNLSHSDIAKELDVHQSTVSRYMKALKASPGKGTRTDLKRKAAADRQHRKPT